VDASSQYSSILVSVDDYQVIDRVYHQVQDDLDRLFPDATINIKKFNLGPGSGGKIQLRINGPDQAVIRQMADEVKNIIAQDPDTKAIRDEWGAKVKLVQPVLAEDRARRLGISRIMVANELKANFSGKQTGVYREGIELIPIIARAPAPERTTLENVRELQIYSPTAQRQIPVLQVMNGLETVMENARISRWHRRSMITIHCDARRGLNSELLSRIKPKIEQALKVDVAQYMGRDEAEGGYDFANHTAGTIPVRYDDIIPLKDRPGYFIAWGGEAESSADANAKLGAAIPIFFGMMILVVIFLFNAFRQPLIIWLTVPLALIGVTAGLLIFQQPFGFMALLGLMSLSGMLIKNAIVLIDQIDLEIRTGKEPFFAVVDSGVSRMRPVAMAALTTIMGMIPLLQDDFFVSMAVTIMFGLGFATLLTLIVVPVLYTIFFKVNYAEQE
jgi:multidrug efflux pump subunit AcrB